MADPLSILASVVGLIAVTARVGAKLFEFCENTNDAPALARHVMGEVYAINAAISTLRTYLEGEAHTTDSQESAITVEHLSAILTACVFTFEELKAEVKTLKSDYMKVLEKVGWARKKGSIAQLFTRLQEQKTSLILVLTILQSQKNLEDNANLSNQLNESVNKVLASNEGILDRLERLEAGVNPNRSSFVSEKNGIASDTISLRSFRSKSSQRTIDSVARRFKSFENALRRSRVYQRSSLRCSINLEDCGTSSVAARSMGWSFMSGVSITKMTQVSVLSLPIYPSDILDNELYNFESTIQRSIAPDMFENDEQNLTTTLGQEHDGESQLHIAARIGSIYNAKVLIDGGANILTTDSIGRTALYLASNFGHEEIVQYLLENGADISTASKEGWTALHTAAQNGHKHIVQILLENGADIPAAIDGWTALYIAAYKGYKDIVQLLLEHGAGVPAMVGGWTALHIAAYKGYKGIVQLLLEHGADISAATGGWTALHIAVQNIHKDVVQLLLENGADISAATKSGWTAIKLAKNYGHKDIISMISLYTSTRQSTSIPANVPARGPQTLPSISSDSQPPTTGPI